LAAFGMDISFEDGLATHLLDFGDL
jgi:hypothetical protein